MRQVLILLTALGWAVTALAADSLPAPTPPAFDALLQGYHYPYPVQRYKFSSQTVELEMAYLDVAPAGKPTGTVVLLHGKNFNAAYWQPTIEALTQRGLRVIAPDQIGFGKSSKPRHYQYSFQQLAHNTRALLHSLGIERAAVVGHSMGGMLAVRFSLEFPEATERLVLVNPIGLEDYAALIPYQTVDDRYAAELEKTPEGLEAYQRKNYYDGRWRPEYAALVQPLAGWLRGPDRELIAWNSALTYDMILTQPVVHELPQIQAQTLLLIGTRDRTALGKPLVSPAQRDTMGRYDRLGRAAAKAIPKASLVEFDDVGHLPQVEVFDDYLQALLSFLVPAEQALPTS